MNYLVNYIYDTSIYKITNVNNIYNCFIDVLQNSNDELKISIINSIKIHIGMTFYSGFKQYVFRKIPKSEILSYFD